MAQRAAHRIRDGCRGHGAIGAFQAVLREPHGTQHHHQHAWHLGLRLGVMVRGSQHGGQMPASQRGLRSDGLHHAGQVPPGARRTRRRLRTFGTGSGANRRFQGRAERGAHEAAGRTAGGSRLLPDLDRPARIRARDRLSARPAQALSFGLMSTMRPTVYFGGIALAMLASLVGRCRPVSKAVRRRWIGAAGPARPVPRLRHCGGLVNSVVTTSDRPRHLPRLQLCIGHSRIVAHVRRGADAS